jgi:hypothetical protein
VWIRARAALLQTTEMETERRAAEIDSEARRGQLHPAEIPRGSSTR